MTAPKRQRTFFTLLAGTTLLIAGLAASATLFGSALVPSEFSSSAATPAPLALAHVSAGLPASANGRENGTVQARTAKFSRPSTGLPATRFPAKPAPSALPVQADDPETALPARTAMVEAALRAQESAAEEVAGARHTAKIALAGKLAKLQLARTLLAANARTLAARDRVRAFAEAPAAALPGALTENPESSTQSPIPPVQVASLDPASLAGTGSLFEPDAVPARIPGIKPEIARRSAPAATKPNLEKPQTPAPVLAYATPGNPQEGENGVFSGLGKLFGGGKPTRPGRNSKVAVYDISAATVHMPDGTKLEAHSGIGAKMDNPKYAHVKNYGPTPPNIYKLRMRERLFHGVEAIRMLPHDRAAMKGRDGMLTHTRLLRRSIGSHGCVAFKDYNKFLNAFKAGKIKTLIVVPSMEKLPTYMAKLHRSAGV
ncbi:DUF2778 domain-containing protein [Labrenzia sp. 011]|uniref:DUF2778 domain-containing protein n=1 Tax=Labrenzia sp. 011 TaxID=2171494 RepID=UPI00197BC3D1|nr:DUF2778 domain-containing protein [Labrenzia sp. 011]